MAGTGLTVAQLGLMARIATASDDTLGALARRTGLDQSTLSRNLRTLEAAGPGRNRHGRDGSAPPRGLAHRSGAAAAGGGDSALAAGTGPVAARIPSDIARNLADEAALLSTA